MDDLLSAADPDWSAFKNRDESYLLKAVGESIRRYCGWHVFPSLTMSIEKLRVGSAGLIELPSKHVTDVQEVAVVRRDDEQILDETDYVWFDYGMVQLRQPPNVHPWGYYGGYGFMPGGYLPGSPMMLARVDLTHGYAECPAEIKQVAYELVNFSSEVPSGNVREIQTPGFRLALTGQGGGMSLSPQQMDRLASFRLGWAR